MEGSESEEIFEKLNLNPQLFVNETLNTVDDLLDSAFLYFSQEASTLLNTDATHRSDDLHLGIDYVRNTIQAALEKRLSVWEKYCFRYCFSVPSGFSLPSENETSNDDAMDQDDLNDEQVDAQLDLLRKRLAEAGKECNELNQELRELETKSAMSGQCAAAVNEALQLYDKSSAQEMLQEMWKVSSELLQKMDQLKSKQKEEIVHNRRERIYETNAGLSNLKFDDLQEFITETNL